MIRLQNIFDLLEEMAPSSLAEEWDTVGLQIGNADLAAKGVIVALDPSLNAIEATAEEGFNLLLTHHPLFFGNINSIDMATAFGKSIKAAVDHNVTIFSAHTNLDSARGGLNDMLADILRIYNSLPLKPLRRSALGNAGLGRIGEMRDAVRLEEVASSVKERLGLNAIRVMGNYDAELRTVAICAGSGGDLLEDAFNYGADLYMTGDIKYHHARKAEELGIALIDFGHFSSEKRAMKSFAHRIGQELRAMDIRIPVKEFCEEHEPFRTI